LAAPELGAKQICPTCQTKFYDLGKRPAHCPKCGSDFDPEEALRSRRSSRRGVTPDYDKDDAEEKVKDTETEDQDTDAEGLEEEVDDTPELDQAVEADVIETDDDTDADPGAPVSEPDLGVGIEEEDLEDDADDVPFLEDEEDDDFADEDIEGLPDEDEER